MEFNNQNKNYNIVDYDQNWLNMFSIESKKIKDLLGDEVLEIHHIGSTSVPGMSGKPTIDMLLISNNMFQIETHTNLMLQLGYHSLGARNSQNTCLFEKGVNGQRQFIVHFYPSGHSEIKQIIVIRDYLRTHKDEAENYSKFKKNLKNKFPNDYKQYRDEKDKFINKLICAL
jgi:GrpB-like predicted nucleotidyltransferase (UPF0157 family)